MEFYREWGPEAKSLVERKFLLALSPKELYNRFSFGERENPFFSCEKKGFSHSVTC